MSSDDANEFDVLIGRYNVPWSGQYFLEIIVHVRSELQHDTDFRQICLVDPAHRRLTREGLPLLPDVQLNILTNRLLDTGIVTIRQSHMNRSTRDINLKIAAKTQVVTAFSQLIHQGLIHTSLIFFPSQI